VIAGGDAEIQEVLESDVTSMLTTTWEIAVAVRGKPIYPYDCLMISGETEGLRRSAAGMLGVR
jgi:hypothetical protein